MLTISYFNEEFSKYREIAINPFFLRDPTLLEIFRRSLPPKEAYYYFPKGEEIIIINQKKPHKSLRRIYNNVTFTQKEQEWLLEFKKIISSHPENKIPDFWNDGYNLAYIYSTECKLDKAYQRMLDYFIWYYKNFPMNIQPGDKSLKLLNTGFTYVYGRDHQFRPIIICQPYILQKYEKEYSEADVLNASIFICQYMSNYMLIPGQIENWIMFINLEKTSLFSLPDSMKKVIKTLSDYFIARLYKSYILGMNGFLRLIFKIMCSFLEEVTVQKFVILESKKDPKLFQEINPQNLEERFGGKAENCIYEEENCLFPPRMPSNEYFKENEDPKEILISEEEYLERYNTGNILPESVSPYIIEKIKREKKMREKEEIARKKREEALIKRNEAKTKAQLNINTTWNTGNEMFELDKFQTCSTGFLDGLKSFRNMKEKFCNNLVTLNDHNSYDNDNLD
jgi:hypothetical protein